MSTRLSRGGRKIERRRAVSFTFDGRKMTGFEGDTLASALLANGQTVVGRSFKYHRPRGIVASGAEEPNALMNLGEGGRFEPNQRATTQELYDGLTAESQNRWPNLDFDVGAINARLSRFLPAGFYYKMFIHPRPLWKHVYEPFIRRSAGLGKAPKHRDADTYEHLYAYADVLVAGGGIAGLQAALSAAEAGARVLLVEQTAHWGGRAPLDAPDIDGIPAGSWVRQAVDRLEAMENVTLRLRTMAAGLYDHGYALLYERLGDHMAVPDGPRHRLWRVRAAQTIVATGAIERPLSFAGNDLPGVMLASAVRDYVVDYGVSPGDRTVIVTNNDDAYRTAIALHEAGLVVPAILDARPEARGALPERVRALGIRVETGRGIASAKGGKGVKSVSVCLQAGEGASLEEIACDAVAMSGGWSPVVHLWSHVGGKLLWDEGAAMFRPDGAKPPTGADGAAMAICAGAANGALLTGAVLSDAAEAGRRAAAASGHEAGEGPVPGVEEVPEQPLVPVWLMPQGAGRDKRAKMWLDYQNDVKVSDVRLAAQEGYESVEHTKRYTTLGMATDQGKLSNINGLAILSNALNAPIPQVGTTTFRPPYTPISMGAIAGAARDEVFQPVRRTPIHAWHEAHGADWEPVGQWRRPYCYRRGSESREEAVRREVLNTRQKLGLLDASTLGKIVVKGPDAGRFLDMLYTNMMSTLPIGKCRYGLMCNEQGFLIDDGVVARLSEDSWLCHTTTGGADRIHAHMEEWLQTEWWDWKVYVANVTEAYAQIAVVGPHARDVLEKLGGMDVGREALPFMHWAEGEIAGIPARVFRISFSGELSYEIAVPASRGQELWDRLIEAGAEFGAMPYGTECLHVLRAEKGFIMVGDESDGTISPRDLNLDWALSKKKDDYIGKRGMERSFLADPERWKLVGLQSTDGSVLPEGGYAVASGQNANGQRNVEGRITSTYYSPTLDRGIAMALIRRGTERMGETVRIGTLDGGAVAARIVDPVVYDKDGEKLHG
ncbi:sarcosine oxidase subunit alpha family protein [Wenxinia saemankumensis]|uniref:Sarcosine oxidase subunit alpha n=1 Tax=Wenxinia saemankumensis TaxID=1447782 RepID=A0A1M6ATF1_9RHOB|nr:sarcosine oxidase subunit alpha family protein [Wenxinia saemankumensis]SHI39745.1 sarcosine oxidase subunit alpha [Wenxinia saemankumensis]